MDVKNDRGESVGLKSDDKYLDDLWNPEPEEQELTEEQKSILVKNLEKLNEIPKALVAISNVLQHTKDWHWGNKTNGLAYEIEHVQDYLKGL